MVVKIDYSDLSEEISKQLQTFNAGLQRSLNEKVEEVAAWSARELQKGGPYDEKSGKYTKDWDHKLKKGSYTSGGILTEQYTVYNKKHYQLTHLLEKGHLSRDGKKRVRPFEHIKPVEEMAAQLMVSKVGEAVREAGNA